MNVLFLAALATLSLAAQTPDFTALDRSAAQELAKLNIPGASVAIVRGETVVYSKGFGTANIETGEAVRPEMLFRLGSTTKMFTAAALVGLAVEGKIDLNAPVGTYVKFLSPKLSRITANQLLSHTAGIRDDAPMYGSHDDSALGNGIRDWTDEWLFTSPGKIFSYSNPGYWLAGYLVEALTSTPYADAMEARLFKPLGMTRTTLRPTMAMTWPLAQGHEYVDGQAKIARPAADNTAGWPAGSIFSNTHDLARFVAAFMNEGRLDGKQVLDPKVIALMSTQHATIPGSTQSYCYGLQTGESRGVRVLEHGGSRTGYGSHIRMIPAQRVAVIVQTNRSGATLPSTAWKALELAGTVAPDSAVSKATVVVSSKDMTQIPGVYENGSQKLEIVARDNRLFLKRARGSEAELIKRGESSFATEQSTFTMVAASDGSVEYVHSGARSFVRVR